MPGRPIASQQKFASRFRKIKNQHKNLPYKFKCFLNERYL